MFPVMLRVDHVPKKARKGAFWYAFLIKFTSIKTAANEASKIIDNSRKSLFARSGSHVDRRQRKQVLMDRRYLP